MKRYIKFSKSDFNEVYNKAYELWVETENSVKVISYLEPLIGYADAVAMLNDIKETSNL